MNNKTELDLLIELVKLVKKYGPETFEALSDLLSNPLMSQNVPNLLKDIAKESKNNLNLKKRTKVINETPISHNFKIFKINEPDKYQLLIDINNKLNDKTALPTVKEIREFSLEMDLSKITAKSRKAAIDQLLNSLSELPKNKLETIAHLILNYGHDDRSLEGWSNIILERPKKE